MTTANRIRRRVLLTLTPIVILLLIVGGAGTILLEVLGRRSDAILRENYDSIRAMTNLIVTTQRIEQLLWRAAIGRDEIPGEALDQYWIDCRRELSSEQGNLTIYPDEPMLVQRLTLLIARLEQAGHELIAAPQAERTTRWQAEGGAKSLAQQVQQVAWDILHLNQDHMQEASRSANLTAFWSSCSFLLGSLITLIVAIGLARRLLGTIVTPIAHLTEASLAIGAGQLGRRVTIQGDDELAQLGAAFNRMADQLQRFRTSNLRNLMRAQETAQAMIDSFPDPMLVIDGEWKVDLSNRAAFRAFGVKPGAITPWHPPEAMKPGIQAALTDQQPYTPESFDAALSLRIEGEERWYLPSVRPIRTSEGDTLGAAIALHDVTRFLLLDQLKGDLVATVSHELKTPLTGLRLALHILLEESIGPLNPKQAELVVDARDNAERLLKLIEQMLALARLEDREKSLERTSMTVGTLLQAAVDAVAPRAQDRRIELLIEDTSHLPLITVDSLRMQTALCNLLINAIVFTDVGGSVRISAQEVPGGIELRVADTGCGIAAEHLPHLFEKFYRVPDSPHPAGTGLGLAIVREIVLAHGGEITCESEVGCGSIFRIRLPLGETPHE